jgi:ribosomal protein L11 methylase PrmA
MIRDGGSYRDPSGSVYRHGDRILRSLSAEAHAAYLKVEANPAVIQSRARGDLIDGRILKRGEWPTGAEEFGPAALVEHPALPCITYPYEWPFEALRAAALAHLDLHLNLLDGGMTLTDASAYNIQFTGSNPVFIDALSVRAFTEGEYWLGHDQFLRQFLNPLMLEAVCGVSYAALYRGDLEGLTSHDLARLLPIKSWFRPSVLAAVVLPARLGQRAVETTRVTAGNGSGAAPGSAEADTAATTAGRARRPLPKAAYGNMLKHLRRVIERLQVARPTTGWSNYALDNSYVADGRQTKEAFVRDFAGMLRPRQLLDVGCNDGAYTRLALEAGAGSVIGLDTDRASLDRAFLAARQSKVNFLPLYADIANPSPSQGWRGQERSDLKSRLKADAVIALAVTHHMAIGRNLPLDEVIDDLIGLAPAGIIEFVPKSDPMVQIMLRGREDIFPRYDLAQFRSHIVQRAQIVREASVPGSERVLFQYQR